jgi:hypothetical protein
MIGSINFTAHLDGFFLDRREVSNWFGYFPADFMTSESSNKQRHF